MRSSSFRSSSQLTSKWLINARRFARLRWANLRETRIDECRMINQAAAHRAAAELGFWRPIGLRKLRTLYCYVRCGSHIQASCPLFAYRPGGYSFSGHLDIRRSLLNSTVDAHANYPAHITPRSPPNLPPFSLPLAHRWLAVRSRRMPSHIRRRRRVRSVCGCRGRTDCPSSSRTETARSPPPRDRLPSGRVPQ